MNCCYLSNVLTNKKRLKNFIKNAKTFLLVGKEKIDLFKKQVKIRKLSKQK